MNKKVVLSVLATAVVASMAASAFAAPKQGLYIGGNVKKFYSTSTLLNMTKDARTAYKNELKTAGFQNLVFVNIKGQGATIKEMIDLGTKVALADPLKQSDFLDSYGVVQNDGTVSGTEEPGKHVDPTTPTGDLKVESVSAINASQIEVKFGKPVSDSATGFGAKNPANYQLTGANLTSIDLSEDGKTATLNITPLTSKTSVAVTVKQIADASDSTKKTELYTTTVVVEDKTPPTVTEVVSKTNGSTASTVTVNFSEPVKVGATFKIDGVVVPNPSIQYTNGNKTATFSGLTLDATKSHTLEIIGLLDTADNNTNPNPYTKSFTVSVDATLPAVSTVEALGDKAILLTFSKKMDATTVNITNIKLKDELLADVQTTAIGALPGDTTGTKFVLPIAPTETLYSASKTSRNLTVLVTDAVADALGNKLATTTKPVTLNKDVTAPSVSAVSFLNDASGNLASLTVEFNEALKAGTYTLAAANLSVIDKDGVDVTSTFVAYLDPATVTAGGKKLVFNMKAAATPAKFFNQYTFTFKAGLVKDAAETGNDSAAYTKVIDFGAQPAGDFVLTGTPASYNAATGVITIQYGRAVKGGAVAGSATDGNNYTLNGVALNNATITLKADKTEAYITLPAGSIPTSDTAAVLRIAGVQDTSGVTITPFVQTLNVIDNAAPVLESARVLDNKTIELTFNEALATVTNAQVGDEFVIYEGTTAKVLATGELQANNVSGFAKKLNVTINKTSGATGANIGNVSPSGLGTGATSGTFNGGTDTNFVVRVATVDGAGAPLTVEVSTDGGTNYGAPVAYTPGMSVGNGVTFTITGTNAATDTFSFTATAAVPGTPVVLDLSKDLSIKTVAPSTGVDVKDLATNGQKGDVTVTVAK